MYGIQIGKITNFKRIKCIIVDEVDSSYIFILYSEDLIEIGGPLIVP